MSNSLKRMLRKRDELERKNRIAVEQLNSLILSALKRKRVTCLSCNTTSTVGKFGFVQRYELDMSRSKWQPVILERCALRCPRCHAVSTDHVPRIINLIQRSQLDHKTVFAKYFTQSNDRGEVYEDTTSSAN